MEQKFASVLYWTWSCRPGMLSAEEVGVFARACQQPGLCITANWGRSPCWLEGMDLMAAKSKISLLDLGRLDVDDGFFIRGATAAVQSNPHLLYSKIGSSKRACQ